MMNAHDHLEFLSKHQPMPDDINLDGTITKKYIAAIEYFKQYPNPHCIPLFLNSFGKGDGFGSYVLVEDVMRSHSKEVVVSELAKALRDGGPGVKEWCAEISAAFPDESLIDPLLALLRTDFRLDTRRFAFDAVEPLLRRQHLTTVEAYRVAERDLEMRVRAETLMEVLKTRTT